MEKMLKLLIIILMSKPSTFESINYNCIITKSDPNTTGETNCCKVADNLKIYDKNVTIFTSDKIDKSAIISFNAEHKDIHYFPRGIDENFPNLQNLVIKNSKLKEVTSNDLKVFRNLQYLDLSHNEIQVLGPKLFNNGYTILQIILNDNKIQFIHATAFQPRSLQHLDMKNNSCTSGMANDRSKVYTLINLIKVSCPYYPLHIKELQDEVQNQQENLRNFEGKIETKLDILYFVVVVIGILLSILILRPFIKNHPKLVPNVITRTYQPTHQISLAELQSNRIYASYESINKDSNSYNKSQNDDFYAESAENIPKSDTNSEDVTLIAIFLICSAEALMMNFTCKHKKPDDITFNISNELLWCNVNENLTIEDENVEVKALNVTDPGRIEAFVADNMNIFYFPKGIDDIFPKLNSITIRNSNLKTIKSQNLKGFKYLQYINLSQNKIEILDENVFNFGVTILYIILKGNRIKFIHHNAFKSYGMMTLNLENNACISDKATDDADVSKLLISIKIACSSIPVDDKIHHLDSNTKDYTLYILIIIASTLLIIVIIYIICNRKSSTTNDTEVLRHEASKGHSSMDANDVRKSENVYNLEPVYDEINYESNEIRSPEIEDFYVETNVNEEIEGTESYATVISALLPIASAAAQPTNITCHYHIDSFLRENNIHTCTVDSKLTIYSKGTEINVLNIPVKPTKAFVAQNKEIFYFPHQIDKFFPKLKFLVIKKSKLSRITSKNLNNFKQLYHLDLSYNDIEILGPNLFRNLSSLKIILLNSNKIKAIDLTAFRDSFVYEYLDLNGNDCISRDGKSSQKKQELMKLAEQMCQNGSIIHPGSEEYGDYVGNVNQMSHKIPNDVNEADTIHIDGHNSFSHIYEEINTNTVIEDHYSHPDDQDFYSETVDINVETSDETGMYSVVYKA
ncbi:toll-like receptor 6 [Chironomus tepperi]|uniref:toll-like receptor 6 n=1 Tax=Chironomus tepperi TaxID=113505 RepID=UPI00391F638E